MTGPAPGRPDGRAAARRAGGSRVWLLLLPAILLTLLSAVLMGLALGPVWVAPPLVGLVLVCAGRMALTATGPVLGLLSRSAWRSPAAPGPDRPVSGEPCRTAILLPIFNEPPEPILRALRVMADKLHCEDEVAFFVLSDTQDPVRSRHEARLFPRSTASASGVPIVYRRRTPNTGRKAGNIARFCQDHGHEFEFAIVLDADSLMSAEAIRSLIDALRRDPGAALIQSVTYPIGGTTLFARMQQFGARLNTPLSVAGQELWQHRRGTYWGHNAIIRLKPFMEHATLPVLAGQPPLGGEILCHDTIEAALLLRGGWDVRLAAGIPGSFETTPSNLIDYLLRERRWCQGNLQHLRLLFAPGFTPASRVHIGMGILYYLVTPAGLLTSLLLLAHGLTDPGAFTTGGSRPALSCGLWLTVALLFAPRLLSMARAMLLPGAARSGFGGRLPLVASMLAEQLLGILLAPIVTVSVTGFVLDTFLGRVVTWNSAARGDRPVGWAEASRYFAPHTAIGVAAIVALSLLRPSLLWWLLPFLGGLVVSIPLACLLGSVGLGRMARRIRLFLTVDELSPSAEQLAVSAAAVPASTAPAGSTGVAAGQQPIRAA